MRAEALLNEYVRNGSEQAFRDLVAAYINFVYATALRSVGGDAHMAQDITQTVFIDLARKAAILPAKVQLGGWLHRHTCFVARKALRKERRRVARERQAIQLQTIADYTQENLSHLAAIIDEVLNQLGKAEREAVILRFFEQHDFQSLGEAIGSSEDAARMRVSRALDKMRGLLQRRGIAMSVSGLAFVLGSKSSPAAPVWLAAKISQVALSQVRHGISLVAILKYACSTRLNVGLGCAAVFVAGVLIIMPKGKASTGPLQAGAPMTPAEIAGLTTEDEVQAPPVSPVATTPIRPPSPTPSLVTAPVTPPAQEPVPPPAPVPVPKQATPVKVAANQNPTPVLPPVSGGSANGIADLFPANSRHSIIPVTFRRKPTAALVSAPKPLTPNSPPKTAPKTDQTPVSDKAPNAPKVAIVGLTPDMDKTLSMLPRKDANAFQPVSMPVPQNLSLSRNPSRLRQRQP